VNGTDLKGINHLDGERAYAEKERRFIAKEVSRQKQKPTDEGDKLGKSMRRRNHEREEGKGEAKRGVGA